MFRCYYKRYQKLPMMNFISNSFTSTNYGPSERVLNNIRNYAYALASAKKSQNVYAN